MNSNTQAFQSFKRKQDKLSNILAQSSEVVSNLQMTQNETLNNLSNKVSNDTFKIQILGTFKNGKSTFINSFLGEEVLPAYATPTTAVITEVKYAPKNKAILHFRNPLPENLPSNIPDKTMQHMKAYGMKNIPPIEIPYDEMEDYVVIPMSSATNNRDDLDLQSPYEKSELYWPLDLLENNVEIVDSPGLNENKARTEVTMQYLNQADSIVFMLNAQAACSEKEMEFIETYLKGQGHEDIIFVVNRLNQVNREKDKVKVMEYIQMVVSPYTSFGKQGIFAVSALDALDGRIENNEEQFNASGMPEFEPFLADFLVNKRGKIKLTQPAKLLKNVLNEANQKVIPNKIKMLDMGVDELKEKYNKSKPKLEILVRKKEQLKERVNTRIENMMPEIRRCVNAHYTELNTNIPLWIDEYKPTSAMKIFHPKKSTAEIINEITKYIETKTQEEQTIWRNDVLLPLMEDKVTDLMNSLEAPLESFYLDVDNFKIGIVGEEVKVADVPVWQRVACAGIGVLVGDIGVAAIGGVNGFSKEFGKNLGLYLGAGTALLLFGLLNPFTLAALILVNVIKGFNGNRNALISKIKTQMKEQISKSFNEQQLSSIDEMLFEIKGKTTELGENIVNALDSEINDAQRQVEMTISEMEKGQANINAQKAKLVEYETKIKSLNTDLDELIFELM